MDKSFNDQELSDIMKEIEALEEKFKSEDEDKIEATPIMDELADLAEEVAIPVKSTQKPLHNVSPIRAEKSVAKTSGTSMSFKVQGDLNLDLHFDIGGKTVSLGVSEEGLTIVMDGGVTFTVPVGEKSILKKSA
jgi:hypothetical protein